METKTVHKFEKPILTREELVEKLKKIFRKHIGRDNAIKRGNLYKAVFGDPTMYEPLELWYNWSRIKLAMNWLRRTTKFFVVSRPNHQYKSVWEYFIVVDDIDSETYKMLLTNTKKKINYMLKRVDIAVEKKFWKDVVDGKD